MTKTTKEIILKVIPDDAEIPEGLEYIKSCEVEELLCTNFKVFYNFEKSLDIGYYKIKNPNGVCRYLWLHGLDGSSIVGGNNRSLDGDDRVRGVLVWNQKSKEVKHAKNN